MIHHEVAQNTDAWTRLRLGIPTASEFHRIITPKGKLARNDTSRTYMNRLLAEWILGHQIEENPYMSAAMQNGHDLEPQAMASYAFERDVDPLPGGFWTTDDGMIGASPDFLVGDNGLLELKCVEIQTHIGYLRSQEIDPKYIPQVMGQLYVCEREWDDWQSYYPALPTVIVRSLRNEEFIGTMASALREFVDEMLAAREKLERDFGSFVRAGDKPAAPQDGPEFITREDEEVIVRHLFPQSEATA